MTLRILDLLMQIEDSCCIIQQRTSGIKTYQDFLLSPDGMFILDGVCMKLIFIGESVKNIDKLTNHTLFVNYPEVPWKDLMGLRDIIVHQYHRIDAEAIFDTLQNDIPNLLTTINKMKSTLSF